MTKWTFGAFEEWVRSSFAQRDEGLRIAREEAQRVEAKVEALRDHFASDGANQVTREEYDRRHTELQREADRRVGELREHHDRDLIVVNERLQNLESWRSNVMGRAVGLGVVGGLIIAGITAILTHLIGGG